MSDKKNSSNFEVPLLIMHINVVPTSTAYYLYVARAWS